MLTPRASGVIPAMGCISDFFVASEPAARRGKPIRVNGIREVDVSRLWALIERRSPDALSEHELSPVAEAVHRFPERLVEALAGVGNEAWVNELARKWAVAMGTLLPGTADDYLAPLVEDLARLARKAKKSRQALFLAVHP